MTKRNSQPPIDNSQPTLLDQLRSGSNLPEYTVSELSRRIKGILEETFSFVRVRGEIGECKLHPSGHLYFSLKDDNSVLAAVSWRGQANKLGIRPETGMEVVCTGRITTYAGQSKYQLVVESISLAGKGALLKLLEDRRRKLQAEGLFDASRKRPLPFLPEVIGVVTSPVGAVIRDILHRIEDRFPRRVILWPVAVQGEDAAEQIAAAIRGFNSLPKDGEPPRPDLIIVARGGGSLEDLMPFNEEIVVRAAAESKIPLISAIGHETDTTLIDYASDYRAPTPTAAAEKAVPVLSNLLAQVLDDGKRLDSSIIRLTQIWRERTSLLGRALGDPLHFIEPLMQRLDERGERLLLACKGYFQKNGSRLAEAAGKLRHPEDSLHLAVTRLQHQAHRLEIFSKERISEAQKRLEKTVSVLSALSPRAVLERGYSLVYKAERVVISANALKAGDEIEIEFRDGKRKAVTES